MGKNSFPQTVQFNLTTTCCHALPQIKEQVEHAGAELETGNKLDQINFRKDFWDCYWGKEKIGQWVTDASPVTTPETIAVRISAPVPFSFRKWWFSVGSLDKQLTLARRYANQICIARYSLRKQPTFGDATTGFPAKWRLRNERRNSILMTRH